MSSPLDADRQAVVAEVRRFVDREVIPVAHDLEKNDIYPFELIDKLKALGVFCFNKPRRKKIWVNAATLKLVWRNSLPLKYARKLR